MGYHISIGEAIIAREEFDGCEPYQCIEVEPATHPDAPSHCPFTEDGNGRSPSYRVWHDFCEAAGIEELFYGSGWDRDSRRYAPCTDKFHRETPLLVEHPGAQPINKLDADYVSAKLAEYRKAHPGAEPGFWDVDPKNHREIDNGKDPTLARLLWLDFWMRWAVDNCERPTMCNS